MKMLSLAAVHLLLFAVSGCTTRSDVPAADGPLTARPPQIDPDYADVIIPEGGYNTVALDMVIARIERLLGNS